MNKELYVSSTPHETKVALMEDDQLAEVFFERENEYTLAGSIYKGRVTRVLPGMQSAFVDIGLERDAFLYVSDFLELTGEEDEDGEFGEIPAPRGAIELGKPQLQEPQAPKRRRLLRFLLTKTTPTWSRCSRKKRRLRWKAGPSRQPRKTKTGMVLAPGEDAVAAVADVVGAGMSAKIAMEQLPKRRR